MNIYNFNVKGVTVISGNDGDFKYLIKNIKEGLNIKPEDLDEIHPKEIERIARMQAIEDGRRNLRRANPFNSSAVKPKKWGSVFQNMLVIVSGDSGIGFNSPTYYNETFEKLNKILKYNDSFVVFVRGNHDNPAFFDGEQVNFSNIKAIPDYSVLTANGKNILCVGGAISVDRIWRKKQEERINKFIKGDKKILYFENEFPVFNEKAINEIAKSVKIDYVVSHSAPSFVMPETNSGVDSWIDTDHSLINDIQNERLVFDKIFEILRDNGSRPLYWAYSHFNNGFIEKRSDTIFRSIMSTMNPVNVENDISMLNITEEEKKKKNRKRKIKILEDTFDEENNGAPRAMPIEGEQAENHNPFDDYADDRNANEGHALNEGRLYTNIHRFDETGRRITNIQQNPLYERLRDELERAQPNHWGDIFGEATMDIVNNGNTIQYTFNDAINAAANATIANAIDTDDGEGHA